MKKMGPTFNKAACSGQFPLFCMLLVLILHHPVYATVAAGSHGAPFSTLEREDNWHVGDLSTKPQGRYKGTPKQPDNSGTGAMPKSSPKAHQQIFEALNRRQWRSQHSKNKGGSAITAAQKTALQRLVSTYSKGVPVKVKINHRNGVPALIKGSIKPQLAVSHKGAEKYPAIAAAFMLENSTLLKLDNPMHELALRQNKTDRLGKVHLRYQQQFKGIPLWGKELLVHLNKNDEIYLFQGQHEPTPQGLNTIPGITAVMALEAVKRHLNMNANATASATTEVVIYTQTDGTLRLTFKVAIKPSLDQRWIYFIDADTGEMVHRINNIHHAGSVVTASGQDLYGTTRSFNAWSEFGKFYQINPMVPINDPPFDPIGSGANATGDTFILDIRNQTQGEMYYTESLQQHSGWDSTGVSAAYNTRLVYDYFLNTFNRQSIDDNNLNLFSVIHFGNNYSNAFWNGSLMVYGDGDNVTFSSLAGCLDVAAHEMTHGVIEHTAALIYENQSGALNESWADFFGAMVDRSDWLMGEDCVISPPGFLRSMADPSQGLTAQPVKMSQYQNLPNTQAGNWGGVHINSGIPNRAAYLVATGLTAETSGSSIGRAKTEQIWYRALSTYLQASSQFIDARRATIQAAEDLYGVASAEANAVTVAWDLVEVTDAGTGTPGNPGPTPTDPVAGSDGVLYLYPVDGSYDKPFDPSESYNLYWQVIPDPFTGYDASLDYGTFNSGINAFYTRPAAYTDTDGTRFFYVGTDNNLYVVNANGSGHQRLTTTGDIYSIAVSPDGRNLAYTSIYGNDKNIHVLDLVAGGVTDHLILPPDYQGDGAGALNTILYPDALAFDYTSKQIVFDVLSCISSPASSCQDGGGYQYWAIGILNLTDGSLRFPFPNQNPNINLAYPSFAANNNFIIAMDKKDASNYETNGTVHSQVVTVNLETQTVTEIINPNITANTWGGWGVPSFFGDDDYLVLQQLAEGVSGTTYRVPIDSAWAANGPAESLNNFDAAMPLVHRAGVRQLTATLQLSKSNLPFGTNGINTISKRIVTLTNTGNRDINISEINLTSSVFTHNGTNSQLPHGQTMDIQVQFKAETAGLYNGTLVIKSDADTPVLVVTLSGKAVATDDTDGDGIPNNIDPDDDNDGLPDVWEQANALNPLEASDAAMDTDGDGLTNLQEYQHGTKPRIKDTDRDGMFDGFEIDEGFNPTDSSDCPAWFCRVGRGGWRVILH